MGGRSGLGRTRVLPVILAPRGLPAFPRECHAVTLRRALSVQRAFPGLVTVAGRAPAGLSGHSGMSDFVGGSCSTKRTFEIF